MNLNEYALDLFSMSERINYIIIIILGMVASYILMKTFLHFLISIKSYKVISFIMSSLVIMLGFLVYILFKGQVDMRTYQLFRFIIVSLAGFSVLLAFLQTIYFIKRKFHL